MTHPDKDSQAELIAAANAVVERWHSRDWKAPHTKEFIERLAAAVGAAKAAPPALDAEGLPDLPQPMRKVYERPHGLQELLYYTAEQVRQAQRDAYEAGKLAAITAAQRKVAEDLASMKARLARQDQQPARTSVDTAAFRIVLMLYNEGEITERQLIANINAWGGVEQPKQEGT